MAHRIQDCAVNKDIVSFDYNSRQSVLYRAKPPCHTQGWGQVHWYLYLSTLKYNFAVLVLILKSYISFMDVLVLVLKYYINVLEYLMYLQVLEVY